MKIRIGAGNAAYASATVYRRAVRNLKAPPRLHTHRTLE